MNQPETSTNMRALYSPSLRMVQKMSLSAYKEALKIARENQPDLKGCKRFLRSAVGDGIICRADAQVIWRGITGSYQTPFDEKEQEEV